jgi:transglutaminase-like putative cysteine protease
MVYITIEAYYSSYATADDCFKIFTISRWILKGLTYVYDSYGLKYIAPLNQMLKTLMGDCDDLAVLLAVLYRSVGLDAGVALIDTDEDGKADHVATIAYLNKNPNEVLRGIAKWASTQAITVDGISYFKAEKGIYLVVDPLMTKSRGNPWHVDAPIYKLVQVIKP